MKPASICFARVARKVNRALMSLTLLTSLHAATAWATAVPAPTPFPIGGYFGNPNGSDAAAQAAFDALYDSYTQLMGTAPRFLVYYVDQRQPVSSWPSNADWSAWSAQQSSLAQTALPVIGFPMTSTASGTLSADEQFKAFAAGQYDGQIQGVVQAWKNHGFSTQYWRPGWEMNLNSMPSFGGTDSATQADWVAAFQHIAVVLRQAGQTDGVNVQVIWNPGATNYDVTGALANLYPGNAFVDMIAADIYGDMYPYSLYDWSKNDGTIDASFQQWVADPVNRIHYWTYPAATQWSLDGSVGHNLSLQVLLDFAKAQGKPFAVPETGAGSSDGGHDVADEAAFPTWLAKTLAASGETIAFVNMWDANADGNFMFSMASANKPGEAAAWASGFGASGGGSPSISPTAWYNVANQNSGGCMDVFGWATGDGSAIGQWTCGAQQGNQEWQFSPTDSGYYTIANRHAPGEVIDAGGSGEGSSIQLWSSWAGPNQQWMPVATGNGFVKLVGRQSGLCLDTRSGAADNGARLEIYACGGAGSQQFKLVQQP